MALIDEHFPHHRVSGWKEKYAWGKHGWLAGFKPLAELAPGDGRHARSCKDTGTKSANTVGLTVEDCS